MSDYEKGLRRLAKELSGSSETPIYEYLRRELLPLLEAAQEAVTYIGKLEELSEVLTKWTK